jgi:hypothetical protein
MDTPHPLYYQCRHDPSHERYGLLEQRSNSFYIIDSDPVLLKKVQLTAMRYEVLHLVNIDHFFTFLEKTWRTVDKYQIKSMTEAHHKHELRAAVYLNDKSRTEHIQKFLNNDSCHLFGMTVSTSRSIPLDISHYRLQDNIIKHQKKDKLFNDELQERLFLIRRILYLLKGAFEYATEFVNLQERICDFGLEEYQKHFAICNPTDTVIPKIVEGEIESNQIRVKSIQQLYNTIYKRFNEINLNQPIKEILLELISTIWANECIMEAEEQYPDFQMTYDINKIRTILKNEINNLVAYYASGF